ncbi:very short patch repair endonuclease [Photobacterium sp.]|uniref:very short patch repair endonuclease n=1 Tax=Photobacterium sp. TaxID=660 RepID=UPI0039B0D03D
MRLYKSKNTGLEMNLRKLLFAKGFRYRIHDKRLPGTPDLVFPKYKAIIFLHGCFWHKHAGCSHGTIPKTNSAFWQSKFKRNKERDHTAFKQLIENGWRVLTVWECAFRSPKHFDADDLLSFIECWLTSDATSCEVSGLEPLPVLELSIQLQVTKLN